MYGAKAYNLFRVERKEAIKNAQNLPPWEPIVFKNSKRTYYFPFRLALTPIRKIEETLVRIEFTYIAENLLLRGGYRRTHFQADQTTLSSVSQMGNINEQVERLEIQGYDTFIPRFTKNRSLISRPEIYPLQEVIIQAVIKQFLSENRNLGSFLNLIDIENLDAGTLEVLSEKALPEGHVDILIKEATPIGRSKKIILEVKASKAQAKDVAQLEKYVNELGTECIAGILISREFPKGVIKKIGRQDNNVLKLVTFNFNNYSPNECYTFEQLKEKLRLDTIKRL